MNERKVYPAGSGSGVSLPKELFEILQVGEGEEVVVELDEARRRLVISPTTTKPTSQASSESARPVSELGRQLRALRDKIVAGEAELLDWEALERETAERRGER